MLPKNSINHEYNGIFVFFTKQFDKRLYRKVNFTIFFLLFTILYLIFSYINIKKLKWRHVRGLPSF